MIIDGYEVKNAGASMSATRTNGSVDTTNDHVSKFEEGHSRNTNVKAQFATSMAQSMATNPNDAKEVEKLRDTIMDATDKESFILSKDGAIMGVTGAGLAALKKTLPPEQFEKLQQEISPIDPSKDEIGMGSYALAGAAAISGGYALNKVTGNPIGKGAKKAWNGIKSTTDKLRGISDKAMDKSTDSSTDDSDNKHTNKPDDSVNDKTTHGNSFNSDMQNYTQNRQNLQEEFKDIGKQKQDLAAKYNSVKMSKEDYTSKFRSLDAKQMSIADDLDHVNSAMQHEEMKAEAENAKKTVKGSWMEKIQDGMSGGGSFRTKLSLIAGATALSYGVDAEAREMSPSLINNSLFFLVDFLP